MGGSASSHAATKFFGQANSWSKAAKGGAAESASNAKFGNSVATAVVEDDED